MNVAKTIIVHLAGVILLMLFLLVTQVSCISLATKSWTVKPGEPYCLYVATKGSDSNTGTMETPFATVERALAAVRSLGNNWQSDVIIYMRGGSYYLEKTLVIKPADSGKNGYRLIMQPYGNEIVTISGGRPVNKWFGPIEGGICYSADIPNVEFRHLVVNSRRAQRARHPNGDEAAPKGSDFHAIAAWDKPTTWGAPPVGAGRRLGVRDTEAWFADALEPKHLSRIEACAARWAGSAILRVSTFEPLKAQDAGVRYLIPKSPERDRLFGDGGGMWGGYYFQVNGHPYHWENSMAFLDAPGEWFLDTATSESPVLYYIPRKNEKLNDNTVIAPVLETLIRFAGDADNRVHDVLIRNLRFTATTWLFPNKEGFVATYPGCDYRDNGGGWDTHLHPAAIHLEGTERVALERNVLYALGGMGIALYDHTRDTVIDGNAILEVAGAGIVIDGEGFVGNPSNNKELPGEIPFPPYGKSRSESDRVTNNRIQRFGLDYWCAAGVAAAYPWGMLFEHNEISEGYGTGFVLGWYGSWARSVELVPGTPALPKDKCRSARGKNRLIGNRVFKVGCLIDDVGGIYTLGQQSPTHKFEDGLAIRGNYVFDMKRLADFGLKATAGETLMNALYLDGETNFTVIADNIFEVSKVPPDCLPASPNGVFMNPDKKTSIPPYKLKWSDAGATKPLGDNVNNPNLKPNVRDSAGLLPAYKNVPSLQELR